MTPVEYLEKDYDGWRYQEVCKNISLGLTHYWWRCPVFMDNCPEGWRFPGLIFTIKGDGNYAEPGKFEKGDWDEVASLPGRPVA